MEPQNTDKKPARKRSMPHAPGTAPGTLKPAEGTDTPTLDAMAYGPDELEEILSLAAEEAKPLTKKWPVTWLNVSGLNDTAMAESLGAQFDLHQLALEDVFNLSHRAKAEDFGEFFFLIARMPTLDENARLLMEQISLFFGKKYVLTFQERKGDVLEPVRERIRKGLNRRARLSHADYLAYAILDTVVDSYYPVLESYAGRLDDIEEDIIRDPQKKCIEESHAIRRDLQRLHAAVWPLREAVSGLLNAENALVRAETRTYLRDCYDHVVQILDMIEAYRERASGLVDLYMSMLSGRMNDIMKVLTIIATVFIPLGFIAGVYGMNFDTASPWNMPELGWRYGYLYALGLMGAIAAVFVYVFWRKGWIGKDSL